MGKILPHLIRYRLHSSEKTEHPETFAQKVNEICSIYENAIAAAENELHTVSVDEMTGIRICSRQEDVLDVYEMPYNPAIPVVRMDEKPYQLLGEVRDSWAMRPGDDKKVDSEYTCNGTCSIFAFIEPLGGMHHVSVREHRTAKDRAEEIKYLSDVMYPNVEKIILGMDNLNTHAPSSLYKAFTPKEARRIIKRLEIHYTPKHGSWLDIAEIELNVMTRQCLSRRISSIENLQRELSV